MKNNELEKGKVVLYKNKVEVKLEDETVWLTQAQMAQAFDTERSVITKHIHNILKSKELMRNSVCAKFAHTANDGKTYQTQFYNLDMVISVGYRVNSKRGTQFRIWATDVLKKHLVDGYTINEKRLKVSNQKYQELRKTVNLLDNMVSLESIADETKGLIKVISEYTKALDLLDDFDHEKLSVPKGTKKSKFELTYEEARKVIDAMRKKFKDSNLVGQEKDNSFKVHWERFTKQLEAMTFILQWKKNRHIYYILSQRITVSLMATNVSLRLYLSVFYKKMVYCFIVTAKNE